MKKAADLGNKIAQRYVGVYFDSGEGVAKDPAKGVYYYRLAADQGDTCALCNLAQCYEEGTGVEKSLDEAFIFFKKAADEKSARGKFNVARCFKYGIGTRKSLKQAINYYQQSFAQDYKKDETLKNIEACKAIQKRYEEFRLAADKGDSNAQYQLGGGYLEHGFGEENEENQGIHYYTLSAEQGNLEACKALFSLYYDGEQVEQSYEKALHYLKPLADSGLPFYLHNLAGFYEKGLGGLEESPEETSKYLKLAADKGLAKSQCVLGYRFQKGVGIGQSNEEAKKYFKMAAMQGYAEAFGPLAEHYQYGIEPNQPYEETLNYIGELVKHGNSIFQHNLGIDFAKGENGLKQSFEEAFKCFKLAADKGYPPSQFLVGAYLKKGRGIDQSYEDAFKYFKLAADNGHKESQQAVGDLYKHGQGIRQSLEEAFKYYKLAADQGLSSAQNLVADCFYHGYGVNQSYEAAIKYCQLGAEQGNLNSLHSLGVFYKKGLGGIGQSYTEAFKYFKKAANQGSAADQNIVGDYYRSGRGVEQSFDNAIAYYEYAIAKGYKKDEINQKIKFCKSIQNCLLTPESGDKESQMMMGNFFFNGLNGFKRSIKELLNILKWQQIKETSRHNIALPNVFDKEDLILKNLGKMRLCTIN